MKALGVASMAMEGYSTYRAISQAAANPEGGTSAPGLGGVNPKPSSS